MAAPVNPHDRTKRFDDDDDDDPVEKMLKKAGCLELHYAVQECMAEHSDWRKCQKQVENFKVCIDNSRKIGKNIKKS